MSENNDYYKLYEPIYEITREDSFHTNYLLSLFASYQYDEVQTEQDEVQTEQDEVQTEQDEVQTEQDTHIVKKRKLTHSDN